MKHVIKHDLISINDFDPDDTLSDEKSKKKFLTCDAAQLHTNIYGAKSLHISFYKVD